MSLGFWKASGSCFFGNRPKETCLQLCLEYDLMRKAFVSLDAIGEWRRFAAKAGVSNEFADTIYAKLSH